MHRLTRRVLRARGVRVVLYCNGASMNRDLNALAPVYVAPDARRERMYAIWSIYGTALGTACAILTAVFDRQIRPIDAGLLVGMLLITGIGVSAGLHRHFSHRSFDLVPWARWLLGLAGVATAQGYLVRWIFDHRVHHQFSDRPGDPHSPHCFGGRRLCGLPGLLHAHMGWLLKTRPAIDARRVRDVVADPLCLWLDRYSPLVATGGFVFPGMVALGFEQTFGSFVRGCLWGGAVRMFLLNHITWAVNSLGHSWGRRSPGQRDESRNNLLLGLLAFGDGWHANHHADPRSARHGWGLGQPDLIWSCISALHRVGIVRSLHLPPCSVDRAESSHDARPKDRAA